MILDCLFGSFWRFYWSFWTCLDFLKFLSCFGGFWVVFLGVLWRFLFGVLGLAWTFF
ncbi:hypothetical protein BDV37DRAFT_255222 [Aspergillus pseudonomiae]|uniref:Uncharacterized protein n=1 Tax=Aspergillus pseudonomiae TaxID=1506151 RepID=A0A5N7D4H2_9EURO|nr:uncharacterized protein BDV37DRAFT_255222 [Aspergillus pseudonomiae]KAE8401320.1 hypothetical protein BDV37DRAFT_255222 [Aspergillus pseudonomiae]